MRFVFPNSHAFRRGRVVVSDDHQAGAECLVEFGDGVTVIGVYHHDGDALHLSVPTYRTARGTQVVARSWRLSQGKDREWRSERIS